MGNLRVKLISNTWESRLRIKFISKTWMPKLNERHMLMTMIELKNNALRMGNKNSGHLKHDCSAQAGYLDN